MKDLIGRSSKSFTRKEVALVVEVVDSFDIDVL